MPVGEGFSPKQEQELAQVVRDAQQKTGLAYTVYVGNSGTGDPRAYAHDLLLALGDRAVHGVVVLVDPSRRLLEIVTGRAAAISLPDSACALAASAMSERFAVGELHGGIVDGVHALVAATRHPHALV